LCYRSVQTYKIIIIVFIIIMIVIITMATTTSKESHAMPFSTENSSSFLMNSVYIYWLSQNLPANVSKHKNAKKYINVGIRRWHSKCTSTHVCADLFSKLPKPISSSAHGLTSNRVTSIALSITYVMFLSPPTELTQKSVNDCNNGICIYWRGRLVRRRRFGAGSDWQSCWFGSRWSLAGWRR